MKTCTFCGQPVEDKASFCTYCGARQLDENIAIKYEGNNNQPNMGANPGMGSNPNMGPGNQGFNNQNFGGYQNNQGYGNNGYGNPNNYGYNQRRGPKGPVNKVGVGKRDMVTAIILSIVTCGIYYLYWVACVNDDLNRLTNDGQSPSGGMVILLSIVTCGIYMMYWSYKMGEKLEYITGKDEYMPLICLGLTFFSLGYVATIIMQDTINKTVDGIY